MTWACETGNAIDIATGFLYQHGNGTYGLTVPLNNRRSQFHPQRNRFGEVVRPARAHE